MTAQVKVIHVLLKVSSPVITFYTSSADTLASLFRPRVNKSDKFLSLLSSACSTERTDEWRSPYRHKLARLPRSLLMSTASSIDLLVDLKEIQSPSPPVAFFLLWEIK